MSANEKYQRIWDEIAAIPPGQVSTYGQIAKQAGFPRGARLVARALREVPADMKLPWFRVIGAGGKISIPRSSPGFQRQVELLRADGVRVENGKVSMSEFAWEPSLDELLWGPESGGQS